MMASGSKEGGLDNHACPSFVGAFTAGSSHSNCKRSESNVRGSIDAVSGIVLSAPSFLVVTKEAVAPDEL